jgi:hypothetical protein
MVFAQSVAEYGALSAFAAGLQHAAYNAQLWFEDNPTTWVSIVVIVCLILILRRKRAR